MELTTEDEQLARELVRAYRNNMSIFVLGRTWYILEYNKACIYYPIEHTFVLKVA